MKKLLVTLALVFGAGIGQAATLGLSGEHYNVNAAFNTIAQAEAIVAGNPATATFDATALAYANGPSSRTLSTWLGSNGSITSGSDTQVYSSVFKFSGFITLGAGIQNLAIGSDDGYKLSIGGGVVSQLNGNRPFATTNAIFNAGAGGTFAFELLFWDGVNSPINNFTGLNVTVNGNVIDDTITSTMAPVPLPAAMPMMLAGFGLAGAFVARRRRRAA